MSYIISLNIRMLWCWNLWTAWTVWLSQILLAHETQVSQLPTPNHWHPKFIKLGRYMMDKWTEIYWTWRWLFHHSRSGREKIGLPASGATKSEVHPSIHGFSARAVSGETPDEQVTTVGEFCATATGRDGSPFWALTAPHRTREKQHATCGISMSSCIHMYSYPFCLIL